MHYSFARLAACLLAWDASPPATPAPPAALVPLPDRLPSPVWAPPLPLRLPALSIVSRSVTLDRLPFSETLDHQKCWATWTIYYTIRNTGLAPMTINQSSISATVTGLVSNSRVPGHGRPIRSVVTLAGVPCTGAAVLIGDPADQDGRCQETVTINLLPGLPPCTISPGETFGVELALSHDHFLYGPADPLLGCRTVRLTLGGVTVTDIVPLDDTHAPRTLYPPSMWGGPLHPDRRSTEHFVSPPDSLYLAAGDWGGRIYHFPEQPVRYGAKYRLRFAYLIAPYSVDEASLPGVMDELRVRVTQTREGPYHYRTLEAAGLEDVLCVVGKWTWVDGVVRIDKEATTLRLDIRWLGESECGECWVDDVTLEPVGSEGQEGP